MLRHLPKLLLRALRDLDPEDHQLWTVHPAGESVKAMRLALEVVDDLYGARIAGVPLEDQAPLIVDPNRMESFSPALQGLETIARWHPKVAELRGVV